MATRTKAKPRASDGRGVPAPGVTSIAFEREPLAEALRAVQAATVPGARSLRRHVTVDRHGIGDGVVLRAAFDGVEAEAWVPRAELARLSRPFALEPATFASALSQFREPRVEVAVDGDGTVTLSAGPTRYSFAPAEAPDPPALADPAEAACVVDAMSLLGAIRSADTPTGRGSESAAGPHADGALLLRHAGDVLEVYGLDRQWCFEVRLPATPAAATPRQAWVPRDAQPALRECLAREGAGPVSLHLGDAALDAVGQLGRVRLATLHARMPEIAKLWPSLEPHWVEVRPAQFGSAVRTVVGAALTRAEGLVGLDFADGAVTVRANTVEGEAEATAGIVGAPCVGLSCVDGGRLVRTLAQMPEGLPLFVSHCPSLRFPRVGVRCGTVRVLLSVAEPPAALAAAAARGAAA